MRGPSRRSSAGLATRRYLAWRSPATCGRDATLRLIMTPKQPGFNLRLFRQFVSDIPHPTFGCGDSLFSRRDHLALSSVVDSRRRLAYLLHSLVPMLSVI